MNINYKINRSRKHDKWSLHNQTTADIVRCTVSINKHQWKINNFRHSRDIMCQCWKVESVNIQKTYDMSMLEFGNGLRCMPQILWWGKPWSGVWMVRKLLVILLWGWSCLSTNDVTFSNWCGHTMRFFNFWNCLAQVSQLMRKSHDKNRFLLHQFMILHG